MGEIKILEIAEGIEVENPADVGLDVGDLTGVLPPSKGGTGVENPDASTISRVGDHDLKMRTTGTSDVTMPTTGTVETTAGSASAAASAAASAVGTHAAATSTHGVSGTLVGTSDAQVITNKDIDGGTASNSRRITVPSATKAALDLLTQKAGTVAYATDLGKFFYSNGSTWVEAGTGSGTGAVNNITNGTFETDASGWSTYADAAAATPADGTGGSPTITAMTRNTSSPLRGTADGKMSKPASNCQGQGWATPFTISEPDRNKPNHIKFDLKSTHASYAAGDLVVYVYDVTNSTLITPRKTAVEKATGSWYTVFDASATGSSYRLILHIATTNAAAWDVYIDNVEVGPGVIAQGSAVTPWQSMTLTTNLTNTTVTTKAKRDGDTLECLVKVAFTAAPASSTMTVTLPAGYTIDTTKINDTNRDNLGTAVAYIAAGSSTGHILGTVRYNSSTSVNIVFMDNATTSYHYLFQLNSTSWFSLLTGGDDIKLRFSLPIVEFAGGTVNLLQDDSINEWRTESGTPSIGVTLNSTSKTDPTLRWRRLGDEVECRLHFINGSGGAASGVFTLPIPSGLTIDTSKLLSAGTQVGTATTYKITGTNYDSSTVIYVSGNLQMPKLGAGTMITGPDILASAECYATYKVPVLEWRGKSNGVMGYAAADQNYMGLMSAAAQTLGGVKTFADGVKFDDAAGQSTLNYFTDWQSFTPGHAAVTGTLGGDSTIYARYCVMGNTVHISYQGNINFTVAGTYRITLPVACKADLIVPIWVNNVGTQAQGRIYVSTAASTNCDVSASISGGNFNVGTSIIRINFSYEKN